MPLVEGQISILVKQKSIPYLESLADYMWAAMSGEKKVSIYWPARGVKWSLKWKIIKSTTALAFWYPICLGTFSPSIQKVTSVIFRMSTSAFQNKGKCFQAGTNKLVAGKLA